MGESRRQKQVLWYKRPGREVAGGGPRLAAGAAGEGHRGGPMVGSLLGGV